MMITELCGRAADTLASYSERPAQKPAILTAIFSWVSLVSMGECQDSTLKLRYDRFLPNPFQFIIGFSPFHSTLYSLSY
jgi:hypothetical protein